LFDTKEKNKNIISGNGSHIIVKFLYSFIYEQKIFFQWNKQQKVFILSNAVHSGRRHPGRVNNYGL